MPERPARPIRPLRVDVRGGDVDEPVRPSGPAPVERPDIPEDVDVHLPRGLRRAIGQQVRDPEGAADVERAVSLGAALVEEGEGAAAVPLLAWAKMRASRVPDIREALGVAHYLAGQYREALNELRAYRRMAATHDQDHLVADCLRGLGRPPTEVGATVQAMLDADGVPPDRQVEGLLVWAGAMRDAGDVPGARSALRRADRDLLRRAGEDARARYDWLTADLAARAGDIDTARDLWSALAELAGDPYDAAGRLAELE